jgi:hypothetical protein
MLAALSVAGGRLVAGIHIIIKALPMKAIAFR